jgi:hypothetical protein
MEVPFFDPTSLPFPDGIESITRKIDPSPLVEMNQKESAEREQLHHQFNLNPPTPPPLTNPYLSTQFPTTPPPSPHHNPFPFDTSPQPAPFTPTATLEPILPTPTSAGDVHTATFRDVNDQATGTTSAKYVSKHELTEKIKIITTLQEYKDRGTAVQNLTINDSLEDLNVELERVRRFVQIHGTVDSYKTMLMLFVNIVELVNNFSRRRFHLKDWGQHFINYDLQKAENYIFMMVEENKRVMSPAAMLIFTVVGSAAFHHFTHVVSEKVGEKMGSVFGNELASTLIKHFTKNPDALSNIMSGVGFGGPPSNNGNNNSKFPPGEDPKERKKKAEEERNRKYNNIFNTTGQEPKPQVRRPPTPPPSPPGPIRAVPIANNTPAPPPLPRPIPPPVPIEPTIDFFTPPSIPKRPRETPATSTATAPVPTFTQILAKDLEMPPGPSTVTNLDSATMFIQTFPLSSTVPLPTVASIQEIPDDQASMTNITEVSVGGTVRKRRQKRMKSVLVI